MLISLLAILLMALGGNLFRQIQYARLLFARGHGFRKQATKLISLAYRRILRVNPPAEHLKRLGAPFRKARARPCCGRYGDTPSLTETGATNKLLNIYRVLACTGEPYFNMRIMFTRKVARCWCVTRLYRKRAVTGAAEAPKPPGLSQACEQLQ